MIEIRKVSKEKEGFTLDFKLVDSDDFSDPSDVKMLFKMVNYLNDKAQSSEQDFRLFQNSLQDATDELDHDTFRLFCDSEGKVYFASKENLQVN